MRATVRSFHLQRNFNSRTIRTSFSMKLSHQSLNSTPSSQSPATKIRIISSPSIPSSYSSSCFPSISPSGWLLSHLCSFLISLLNHPSFHGIFSIIPPSNCLMSPMCAVDPWYLNMQSLSTLLFCSKTHPLISTAPLTDIMWLKLSTD